jgi:hypothetical protein
MLEPEAETLLRPLPEPERYTSWHLVLPDGTYLRHAEASVALLELVDPLRPMGVLVRRFRLEWLIERLERRVSEYRGELGRLVPRSRPIRRFP